MKKILIILILVTTSISLTGCYDAIGLESYAYVIALGIDYVSENEIDLTLQFSKPEKESGSKTSSSEDTTITTIRCHTIDSGIALINAHISKKVNLSHCQEIIFSEKIAEKGISHYLDTLINNIEIRTDCNIVVCTDSSKDYISNIKPTLENLTARYYESTLDSINYTGYTVNTNIAEFYSNMKDSYSEAYCILGGLSR